MKKSLITMAVFLVAIVPSFVYAEQPELAEVTDEDLLVAQTTKYYKTITETNNLPFGIQSRDGGNNPNSYTIEITEEEYNNANVQEPVSTNASTTIETAYKKMTTSIFQDGAYYQYKNVLEWKTMPSVRSYDIMGIGMDSTVRFNTGIYFYQDWCLTSGECGTYGIHLPKFTTYGGATVYKVRTGSLSSLKLRFYFDVEKNTSLTLYGLTAYGDYSHATTTVDESTVAQHYDIGVGGLTLDGTINASYDFINAAEVNASVVW